MSASTQGPDYTVRDSALRRWGASLNTPVLHDTRKRDTLTHLLKVLADHRSLPRPARSPAAVANAEFPCPGELAAFRRKQGIQQGISAFGPMFAARLFP
jgi:hypothetical protein